MIVRAQPSARELDSCQLNIGNIPQMESLFVEIPFLQSFKIDTSNWLSAAACQVGWVVYLSHWVVIRSQKGCRWRVATELIWAKSV